MNEQVTLQAQKEIEIRFSEVDSMNIVWHGSYVLYLEDAREAFGKKYKLEYLYIYERGYFIKYRNTEAAKLIFDYEIYNLTTGELALTATTTQVFLDTNYQLLWTLPDFMNEWKQMNGIQ